MAKTFNKLPPNRTQYFFLPAGLKKICSFSSSFNDLDFFEIDISKKSKSLISLGLRKSVWWNLFTVFYLDSIINYEIISAKNVDKTKSIPKTIVELNKTFSAPLLV